MHATRRQPSPRRSVRNYSPPSRKHEELNPAGRLPRSLANMRTVLSHYQTLLDDYRTPSVSFPETMNTAPHRGFLGDHRSVVSRPPACALVSDIWPGTPQIPLLGPVTGRH
jgi:hypothetical protein